MWQFTHWGLIIQVTETGAWVRQVGKQIVSDGNVHFVQIKTKPTTESEKPDKNPTN